MTTINKRRAGLEMHQDSKIADNQPIDISNDYDEYVLNKKIDRDKLIASKKLANKIIAQVSLSKNKANKIKFEQRRSELFREIEKVREDESRYKNELNEINRLIKEIAENSVNQNVSVHNEEFTDSSIHDPVTIDKGIDIILENETENEDRPNDAPKSEVLDKDKASDLKEMNADIPETHTPSSGKQNMIDNLEGKVVSVDSFSPNNYNSSINSETTLPKNEWIGEIPETEDRKNILEKITKKIYSAIIKFSNKMFNSSHERTSSNKLDQYLNNELENLPEIEKKIIKKTMKEEVPLEFESPIVKKNYKDFFKNSIVKYYSGYKIPSQIKNIIESKAKKILLSVAVLTIWTQGASYVKADGAEMESLNKKDLIDATKNKIIEIGDLHTYNQLSENGRRIYLYEMSQGHKQNYLIADKARAEMYAIGKDGVLLGKFPILLGQTKGEFPNQANVESLTAGKYATTPAGKYKLGRKGLTLEEDQILYDQKVLGIIGANALAIHITYPGELIERSAKLATQTPDDNRVSWGCINLSKEMWIKYIEDNFKGHESIYITTDYPMETYLDPNSGEVANNINDSISDTFVMTSDSSGKTVAVQKQKIKTTGTSTDIENNTLAKNDFH